MKKTYFLFLALALVSLLWTSCKTTEKNYREAYEKAVAENDRGVTDFDKTIYNRYRSQITDVPVTVDGKTYETRMIRVKVTPDGGGIREWLKKYSVVVGEFKQLFNAKSLSSRYREAGYPRTFIVENAEPYYYILAGSSNNITEMQALADSIAAKAAIPLKEGFPYIMQIP